MPAKWSYHLVDVSLSGYSKWVGKKKPPEWKPLKWKNLYFPNPLGPAGGIDKSAKHIKAWWSFGAGFIEVGTITPLPQKSNPGPNIKRNVKKQVLWNHLGFPGDGLQKVSRRLQSLGSFKPTPVFANIGKNRWTSNQTAEKDYIQCISELHPYVDGFVINISSPNTHSIRDLTHTKRLKPFLQQIGQKLNSLKKPLPFFVKWSPDALEQDFLHSLDISLECGTSGHTLFVIQLYQGKGTKSFLNMEVFPGQLCLNCRRNA